MPCSAVSVPTVTHVTTQQATAGSSRGWGALACRSGNAAAPAQVSGKLPAGTQHQHQDRDHLGHVCACACSVTWVSTTVLGNTTRVLRCTLTRQLVAGQTQLQGSSQHSSLGPATWKRANEGVILQVQHLQPGPLLRPVLGQICAQCQPRCLWPQTLPTAALARQSGSLAPAFVSSKLTVTAGV